MQQLKARLENLIFYLLLLVAMGLLAWLSTRYEARWDWSSGARNTLSETSQQMLARLDSPLRITSFAPENPLLRQRVNEAIQRYQYHKPDIELIFINPETHPEQIRQLGITLPGELLLEYQGRSETLRQISEQALSNAIQRLAQQREHWLIPITGHGERNMAGAANFDLGDFSKELTNKGFQVQSLDIVTASEIPQNIGLLIIASPRVSYLPSEVQQILGYVEQGGNLLWLADPGGLYGLEPLAKALGIRFLPGVIVDPNASTMNIQDPAVALVPRYPQHPATSGFELLTVFPHSAALIAENSQWQVTPLLTTLPRTWNETGPVKGEVSRNSALGEQAGPLHIGIAFSRDISNNGVAKQQRMLVIGDGDFLSNAYLGNGGNLNLGLNLIRWLTSEESMLNIPAKTAPDLSLNLSRTATIIIGFGFLAVLPLGLFGSGIFIWWRRRRR
ncbi:Gliding motility-associated ABC transporter substrate-binding protein GldG [hydrothermal vent metagenome]|uniref:Gliding motility-associated ABC transporter substrate-binding protein GldG n=1 Tax=hydrothermal vent metagenome TaxID=652676 RepID=A0A3B1BGE5_9ZZZZ